MASKEEYRRRAQRLVNGPFNMEDLNKLFLFLRERSLGRHSVYDVGNMVGHSDQRIRGISVERVTAMHKVAHFHVKRIGNNNLNLNLGDCDPEFIEVMDATFLLIDDELLKFHTGLKRDQASTKLTKLKRKFSTRSNGRHYWSGGDIKAIDFKLMDYLSNVMISGGAYNPDSLFNDFAYLLLKNGFISEPQIPDLSKIKDNIAVYAIAAMHGTEFILGDGITGVANAGWNTKNERAVLLVGVTVQIPYKSTDVGIVFPIFETDLLAKDWSHDYDPNVRHASWQVPIEMTQEPKLRCLD